MNSSSSGRRLEGFLSGKGFYIVLFLCAAVIGASAWMTVGRNETMSDDALQTSADSSENRRVETVIIPARPDRETYLPPELEEEAPAVSEEEPGSFAEPAEEAEAVSVESSAPVWVRGARASVFSTASTNSSRISLIAAPKPSGRAM